MTEEYELVAVKRRWVPEWLFWLAGAHVPTIRFRQPGAVLAVPVSSEKARREAAVSIRGTSWLRELWHANYWYRRWRLGFVPSDLWALDAALFKWMLPRVRAYRESEWCGCPCTPPVYVEGDPDGSTKRWHAILAEIVWFLEYMNAGGDWPMPGDEEYRRVMRGYGLLVKWLPAMWE